MKYCLMCEAWVVQWSVCWTLGLTARVQVLAEAWRCVLKQDASLASSRIGRKTVGSVSCRVGVRDVNFPRTRLLCGGCPPLGWDGWKRLVRRIWIYSYRYLRRISIYEIKGVDELHQTFWLEHFFNGNLCCKNHDLLSVPLTFFWTGLLVAISKWISD